MENPINVGAETPEQTSSEVPAPKTRPLTLKEWQFKYEQHLRFAKPTTRKRYTGIIEEFLRALYNQKRKRPMDVFPADVIAYRTRMERDGLTKASIVANVSIVATFFNWLIEEGAISYNPCYKAKTYVPVFMEPLVPKEKTPE